MLLSDIKTEDLEAVARRAIAAGTFDQPLAMEIAQRVLSYTRTGRDPMISAEIFGHCCAFIYPSNESRAEMIKGIQAPPKKK